MFLEVHADSFGELDFLLVDPILEEEDSFIADIEFF